MRRAAGVMLVALAGCSPLPIDTETVPQRPTIVRTVEPWTYAGREGRVIETDHFRIFTTIPDSILLDRFPRFAEVALEHYTRALGPLPKPEQRLDAFVMGSRSQWASLTRQVTGPLASTYLQIERGGYAFDGQGLYFDIGPRDTLAIASHEGWHQFTQATFKHPLPIWLEEGIASYMEGFVWSEVDRSMPEFRPWANPERYEQLRELVGRGRAVSLPELLRSRPQDLLRKPGEATLDFYAQSWALVHALADNRLGGEPGALRELVRDAAEGRLFSTVARATDPRRAALEINGRIGSAVFETYFGMTPEQADPLYQRFIRDVSSPGARGSITRGERPAVLLRR
ncbi:MAG: DUF1570 domain-containing protein [Planctomycetota bacterium]